MQHTLLRRLAPFACALPLAAPTPAAAQATALGAPFPDLPPAPEAAPLPAWLRTGARVTYLSGQTTHPSVRQALAQDDDGKLWSVHQPSAGGAALLQYDLVHADGHALAARGTLLTYTDASLQAVQVASHQGHVGDRNGLLDVWLHPARLAAVPEERSASWTVLRGPYQLGGETYRAITLRHTWQDGYSRYTYDLDTGLLLVHSATTTGRPVLTPTHNGGVGVAPGAVTVTTVQRRGLRRMSLPWLDRAAEVPSWLSAGQSYVYRGGETNSLAAGLTAPFPLEVVLTVTRRERGFVVADTSSVVNYGGNPSGGSAPMVYGPGTVASLFCSPEALRTLQPGAVLDRDPLTHHAIEVTARDATTITLGERGPLQGTFTTFELATGRLVRVTHQMQQGPALVTRDAWLQAVQGAPKRP